MVTGRRGGVKAPGPEGIKDLVKGDRSPVSLVRVEAAGRVLTAVSGVDPKKTAAPADGEADRELAELSKAWKGTL